MYQKKALIVSVADSKLRGREENINMMLRICKLYKFDTVIVLKNLKQTTAEVIRCQWETLRKGSSSKDVLLFYFHGHGENGYITCEGDENLDPSYLLTHNNDYGNTTAIFDTCQAGSTPATEIHSIQQATCYLAASNLNNPSYATDNGSLLTLALYDVVSKPNMTNQEVVEQVSQVNEQWRMKNLPNNPVTQWSLGSVPEAKKSPFLSPLVLNNRDSGNAKMQDRFLQDVDFVQQQQYRQ